MPSRMTFRVRCLRVVAMLGLLALAGPISARAEPTSGFVDAGELDPTLLPLLDALVHVHDAPSMGMLESITTDGSGMMLHFVSLTVLLPQGKADEATVPPLVPSLLDRQSVATLLPDSGITYGSLARAAPTRGAADTGPTLLSVGGSLSPLPPGA